MMEDTRAHICYVCNGEGATLDGDCENCEGTGVMAQFEGEEDELDELKWTMGEIEVALELLAEMRQAIKVFYGFKDIAPEETRLKMLGQKVVEWFDE